MLNMFRLSILLFVSIFIFTACQGVKVKKKGRNVKIGLIKNNRKPKQKNFTLRDTHDVRSIQPLNNKPIDYQGETIVRLLSEAHSYLGTPYKYGGSTNGGLDCSYFIIKSFSVLGISMPRTSLDQSRQGVKIPLYNVRPGDLLFFKTRKNIISHVGIVSDISNDQIRFIHASTSSGVMYSSLSESYWKKRWVMARRVLFDTQNYEVSLQSN